MPPCGVVYDQNPPLEASYLPGTLQVHEVDCMVNTIQVIIYTLKENLVLDQNQMK